MPGIRQSSTSGAPTVGLLPVMIEQSAVENGPPVALEAPMKATVRPAGGVKVSRRRTSVATDGPLLRMVTR
ncbi:hypothetical protein D3C81_1937030 [compost metagenome]